MNYTTLQCHTFFSLLNSSLSPEQIAVRSRQIGSTACAITDYASLSGIPAFIKSLTEACKFCGFKPERHLDGGKGKCSLKDITCPGYAKDPIKPILGNHFLLSQQDPVIKEKENSVLSGITILAKNLQGWKDLIQASTESNKPEHFHEQARLNLDKLSKFSSNNWIAISGQPRSQLANICFTNPKLAYVFQSYEDVKSVTKDQSNLKKDLLELADKYKQLFPNFYIGKQLIDKKSCPASEVLNKIFEWVAKELNIETVAVPDPHYASKEFAADQRVLLCSDIESSLEDAEKKLIGDELSRFFKGNNYHIPSGQELIDCGHTEKELQNSLLISEMCEKYDVFGKPQLPNFESPAGKTPDEYLRELCIDGWKNKIENLVKDNKNKKTEYGDRVKKELGVLCGAKLAPYFLIVHDFNKYAREKLDCPRDPGRGSAAGCLVSFLLDITDCDPIKYDLSFERFYNEGRNDPTTGKFAIPDIDMDYPPKAREGIVEYIIKKYGRDKVCQMATFAQLQGREAMSTVFRAHGWGSFEDKKRITSFIAQKDKITDDLQKMMEEEGEASIIKWSLENNDKELKPYCELKEDGSLDGPLAKYFAQAMRLEGTKKSQGKHASGLIISPVPIWQICPMSYDKNSGEMVTSYDMYACDPAGLIKFDILGTSVNQKIVDACKFAKYGKVK